MSVRISSLLLTWLRAEADVSRDVEVCGLLFGERADVGASEIIAPATPIPLHTERSRSACAVHGPHSISFDFAQDERGLETGAQLERMVDITDAIAATNVSLDPARAFEIDPAAVFAAIRAERAGGPVVIGHYHSHPSGLARPSACDAASAGEAGRLWLILSRQDVTLWRAVPGGAIEGAFEPVRLEVVGEAVALNDVNRHKGARKRV